MPSEPSSSSRPVLRSILLVFLGVFLFAALSSLVGYSLYRSARSLLSGVHFNVSNTVDVADIGLPVYAGATPHQSNDDDDDDDNAHIWAMIGKTGMKVEVASFSTSDSPQKVAAFYRQALGQYGPVYDCSTGSMADAGGDDDGDQDKDTDWGDGNGQPSCSGDHADGIELKAGTKRDQHVVSIKPADDGKGSNFSLVYVRVHGLRG